MVNNILIFRTDRIGDLLYSCPTILTIKNNFPESSLTLISSAKNELYAKKLNFFDNVFVCPKNGILKKIKFIFFILKKKFDYIFVLDGKKRSLISILFNKCRNKFVVYPDKKIISLFKIFNISFIKDDGKKPINDLFQEMINVSKINTKISNYDFLKNKKYEDSYQLSISNYLHIHFDEKWFNNTYIKTLSEINPTEKDFVSFLKNVASKKNHILITTGNLKVGLLEEMKNTFFIKKAPQIYFKEISGYKIFFVENSTFHDLEFLVKNSKALVSCHGALLHAASAFQIKILDIFEKNQEIWYRRHTKHIKNYNFLYRKPFNLLKKDLLSFFN